MTAAPQDDAPVVIIGAGLAGLTVALHLADTVPVVVLAKRELTEAATAWAQGGIVGVLGSDDSIDSHVRDTQDAGAGLVDEATARFIAERSAACRPGHPLSVVRSVAHTKLLTGCSRSRCSGVSSSLTSEVTRCGSRRSARIVAWS